MCSAQGYSYMVFAQGIDVNLLVRLDSTLGSCYCTNDGLSANAVVEGESLRARLRKI